MQQRKSTMVVEDWPLAKIKPYPGNPRKRKKKAVEKVAASIKEFGFRQPIVVDEAGVILVGHTRRDAAELLKLKTAPVHQAKGLTEAQKIAYRIADNRTNEETEWDLPLLDVEIKALGGMKFDIGLTGFDMREVSSYLRGGPRDGEDDIPEVQEAVVSQRGDLWVLGTHRLLCGDSTSEADVKRLMGKERAGLMNTDPPYGIDYDSSDVHATGVSFPRISSDQLKDEEHQVFLEAAFRAALTALRPNAAWYLWHAMLTQGFFAAAAAAHVCLHRQIIWVKPILVFGRGQYHWRHELCFMGWVEGHQPPDYAERNQTTVWDIAGVKQTERDEFKHSTPKPVEIFRIPILKHLREGEIAFEPFSGSGPQFIAAESENRRCFGLEIEPRYCDVIIRRWEKFTGKKAKLGDGTYKGLPFEKVKEGRRLGAEDEIKEEVLNA